MITLFLLDDMEMVREAIRRKVTADGDIEIVGEASSVAEALEAIPRCRPQVAILDVLLGDGSGVDVCRRMRSELADLRCFMLTAYADREALMAAVMAGASGFILKDVRSDIAAAVRRVAAGETLLDPIACRVLLEEMAARVAKEHSVEREVLNLVGVGLTDRQISEQLSMPEQQVREQVRGLLHYMPIGRWLRRA